LLIVFVYFWRFVICILNLVVYISKLVIYIRNIDWNYLSIFIVDIKNQKFNIKIIWRSIVFRYCSTRISKTYYRYNYYCRALLNMHLRFSLLLSIEFRKRITNTIIIVKSYSICIYNFCNYLSNYLLDALNSFFSYILELNVILNARVYKYVRTNCSQEIFMLIFRFIR